MRFDTIIIGSGLAGLICGIKLAQEGRYCALISSGQSALHFSSGSFDLLNYLPDGTEVSSLQESLPHLLEQEKNHPYSIVGAKKTFLYAQEAESLLRQSGLILHGSFVENHYRLSPMGKQVKTWLSYSNIPYLNHNGILPWKKIAIMNIAGFLDFYPETLCHSLQSMGIETNTALISTSALELLRENPSEFRSINIARVLEVPENFNAFAKRVKNSLHDAEAVMLPACIGIRSSSLVERLESLIQRPVMLMPTLPPSLFGACINTTLTSYFQKLGGVVMPGDTATHFERDGNYISKLFTKKHEDVPLFANHYVLATGSFFSQGLKADMHHIYEPVFGLDMDFYPNRDQWVAPHFFDPQPYAKYGVIVDRFMRGSIEGNIIANTHAIGMVLGGCNAIALGCGGGVALVTALAAAHSILEERPL